MKALAKNRDERYATMGELVAALEQPARRARRVAPDHLAAAAAAGRRYVAVLARAVDAVALARSRHAAPPPRRSKGETRPLHEPEFVGAPLTFEPVFQDAAGPSSAVAGRWWCSASIVAADRRGRAMLVLSAPAGHDGPARRADAAVRAAADRRALVVRARRCAEPPADATDDRRSCPADAGGRPTRDAGIGPHPADRARDVYVRPGDARRLHGTATTAAPRTRRSRSRGAARSRSSARRRT